MLATDLALVSLTSISPNLVQAEYQVLEMAPGSSVDLSVYRSADASYDAADLLVGTMNVSGDQLSVGSHTVQISLDQPLDINPTRKYVLAVADPSNQVAETNESNNQAFFRKWAIGVVTHGVEYDGQFPAWVTTLANDVDAQGYDFVLPYDWSLASGLPIPEAVPLAVQGLRNVMTEITSHFQSNGVFQPSDVFDTHLIGHSRGGGMLSQAASVVTVSPAQAAGFLKLSLLDPHPTRNGAVPYFSYSSGPIGTYSSLLFQGFQAQAQDAALTIPANVDLAEVFYQHTVVGTNPQAAAFAPDELFIVSWGEVPAQSAAAITNYYDVTAQSPSHYLVHEFYRVAVVPTLGVAAPLPIPVSPVPQPPTNGGPAFPTRQGLNYERVLLRQGGSRGHVADHLLRAYDSLNRYITARRYPAANWQFGRMTRFIASERGVGIPAETADNLLASLETGQRLLVGRTPIRTIPLSNRSRWIVRS